MCGIIGYIGEKNAVEIILDGLRRLEYRGYDSAGMSVISNHAIETIRTVGRVQQLSDAVSQKRLSAHTGIGHTRWATHGKVSVENAHPHMSSDGKFSIVHNGVVENYEQIKKFLISKGYSFKSETDTEALANLIAYHYNKESSTEKFLTSVRKALIHVEGTYGIAVLCKDYNDSIIVARKSSPIIIGIGNNEIFIASDASAVASYTKQVVYLNDMEVAHVTKNDFRITTINDQKVDIVTHELDWDCEDVNLGEFSTFMLKEIYEQPKSLENAMRGRFSEDLSTTRFGGLRMSATDLRNVDRIVLCACGTARHACLVAEYLIEKYARIPVEVEYAHEFKYSNAPLDKNTLVITISQSGETFDTLSAMKEAKRRGYRVLSITNVVGSTIARESDGGIYQHAGPEIGVASTKAFTSQICIAAMLALYFGRLRHLSFESGVEFVKALQNLPNLVKQVLEQDKLIQLIAKKYYKYDNMLFLGRQAMFPIAMEGALKLKEISYIHAEGYPAAEIKHGPMALISENCPCVYLATQRQLVQKSLSSIEEVRARGAKVIAVTYESSDITEKNADDLITIPDAHEAIQPILATIIMQFFAYHIAKLRGCDVDKPRNLAKSVTVE